MSSLAGNSLTVLLPDLLGVGKPFQIRSLGVSMHPFIQKEDMVTLVPRPRPPGAVIKAGPPPPRAGDFKLGDIILFRSENDQWFLHRVIARRQKSDTFITKGDSLLQADQPVKGEEIRAKMSSLRRARTQKKYQLDRPSLRLLGFLIALLSRAESALISLSLRVCPSLFRSSFLHLTGKLVKSPKWLLVKIFIP